MPNRNKSKNLSLTDQFNAAGNSAALVFDLDNTIVDISSLYKQMEENYTAFLSRRLNISKQAAHAELIDMLKHGYYIQDEAFKRHGIPVGDTLVVSYDPSQLDFQKLVVDPNLKGVLDNINCDKYVLTNATSYYAEAVLAHLGLRDCFNGVSGIDAFNFHRKPHGRCYNAFENLYSLSQKEIHFFEDTPENLDAAYFIKGWKGHIVEGHRHAPAYQHGVPLPSYVHSRIDTLMDLK